MTTPKTKRRGRLLRRLSPFFKPSASPSQGTADQSNNSTGPEDRINDSLPDPDPRLSSHSDVPATSDVPSIPDTLEESINDWEKAYSIAGPKLSQSERKWLNSHQPKVTDDAEDALCSLIGLAEDSKERMADKQWKLPDQNGRLIPVRDRVEKVLKSIHKYACIVDVGIQHSPEISALVWAGIRFVLQAPRGGNGDSHDKHGVRPVLRLHLCRLAPVWTVSDEVIAKFRNDMEMALPEFYAAVLVVSVKAVGYFESCKASNYLKPFSVALKPYIDDIDNSRRKLEDLAKAADMERTKDIFSKAEEILQVAKGLESDFEGLTKTWKEAAKDTKKLLRREEDSRLSLLPRAHNAAFDSAVWEHRPYCAEGTRAELLKTILDWSGAPEPLNPTPTIFWLNGMAGTGKSTIAQTIVRESQKHGRLGASFFFSKGHDELSNAKTLFTTIAVQFSRSIPGLQPLIFEAVNSHPDIQTKGLVDQWNHLVLEPIINLSQKSQESQSPQRLYLVVIDALDECEGEDDVRLIPFLLSQAPNLPGIRLKILITSRPDVSIRYGFSDVPTHHRQDFVLHYMSLDVVEKDISVYVSSEFAGIRKYRSIPSDWPSNDAIQLIARKSMGLFIYAATVCRFLRHTKFNLVQRLDRILQDTPHPSSTEELDRIYTDVLVQSVTGSCTESEKSELSNRFKLVVGSLVVLSSPLTAKSISKLLGEDQGDTDALLDCLRSVLELPDTSSTFQQIRLVHPSFRDFLLNSERCRDPLFHVNERKAHKTLFFSCLELMLKKLRYNICDLHPGDSANKAEKGKLESALPQSLRYACRHWILHLLKSEDELQYEEKVYSFLRDHYLHWLEALGLMGMISEGINAVRMLEAKVPNTIKRSDVVYLANDQKVATSGSDKLRQLAHDSRRFIVKNRPAIEKALLQAYISALIFSPRSSIVRRLYCSCIPMWIRNSPRVQNDWDSLLQTLEGHSGYVYSVAFSPDGKLLASGSFDETVRLWDAATGASRRILKGHSSYIQSVAFSPDGKLLASGSLDKTVRLWDAATGASLGILEGYSHGVYSVAFSPDGKLLASGPSNKTIRLWEVEKKESIEVFEMGFYVYNVSFSSDGTLLVTDAGTENLVSLPAVENKIAVPSHEQWSMDDEWIAYGSRKLVFVPVEFKGYTNRVYGNCVALVDGGHKIKFIHFDPSALTE